MWCGCQQCYLRMPSTIARYSSITCPMRLILSVLFANSCAKSSVACANASGEVITVFCVHHITWWAMAVRILFCATRPRAAINTLSPLKYFCRAFCRALWGNICLDSRLDLPSVHGAASTSRPCGGRLSGFRWRIVFVCHSCFRISGYVEQILAETEALE